MNEINEGSVKEVETKETGFWSKVGACLSTVLKNPEAMKAAVDCLNDGGVVGIFPEGTINRTKEIIMPFKYGAVKMAKETNTLIVPFAINGEYKFLRKSVVIEFGKPYKVNDGVEIENKRLEDKVIKLLKEKRNGRT